MEPPELACKELQYFFLETHVLCGREQSSEPPCKELAELSCFAAGTVILKPWTSLDSGAAKDNKACDSEEPRGVLGPIVGL